VQGKDAESARNLLVSARDLENAGAFMLVMECIPELLASKITRELRIPTIGIGAGRECDGQVLVYHDTLGLFERFTPKFAKQYLKLGPMIIDALKKYRSEVKAGTFPGEEHIFKMSKEEAGKV